MSSTTIQLAENNEDIRRCHPVMRQLRTRYSETAFVEQVQKQIGDGYQLVFIEVSGTVQAVAGFRIYQNLVWRKFMYVDDLVSDEATRGQGYGSKLFDWLIAFARGQGCTQLHLDSGVEKHNPHRFYLGKGMDITCHHFGMKV